MGRPVIASLAAVALLGLGLFGFALLDSDPPDGWALAGSDRDAYAAGVVQDADRSGAVAFLASTDPAPDGFGTLMQMVAADAFRGQRVRMTAHVRTEDVAGWAGLWVRVDGAGTPPPALAFDNMQGRPITGTSDWTPYSVVVDVPETAQAVGFGVLLEGSGRVLIDDVSFERVDESVPTTGQSPSAGPRYPAQPANLDFER